jgi:hypothetical protein
MKEQAQIEWDYSKEIDRSNPLIIQLMGSLGLSSSDIDNLFTGAAKL